MSGAVVTPFFHARFAHGPDAIASAPARVNVIGEHTDYNGGEVLPIGIERRTAVAVRAVPGALMSRIVSTTHAEIGTFDVTHPVRAGQWWDYVVGVVHILAPLLAEHAVALPQLEIAVASDVPAGAGLSSSAALEVAAAVAIAHMVGFSVTLDEAAQIAWRAETEFVGVPCGIMDQYASALARDGRAIHLWCDTLQVELVPCRERVLIFDTGLPRELRRSSFARRRAECADALAQLQRMNPGVPDLAHATVDDIERAALTPVLRRRALHVVQETARVRTCVAALQSGEGLSGALLLASHESLRDLYDCSTPELDWFVEHVMRYSGVLGARLTGAGWGGCAIAIGEGEALAAAAEPVAQAYRAVFPHTPRSWLTQPAAGARVEL